MTGQDQTAMNPFRDLPAARLDGRSRDLTTNVVPLGEMPQGEVVRVLVESEAVESVLILGEDEAFTEAGVIVGGGPPNEAFDYRIPTTGRYYVFVLFTADVSENARRGKFTLSTGDADYRPPAMQRVAVGFAPNYLSDPGLFDPESGSDDERALLDEISEQVADGIIDRLRTIFADTPIEVFDEREGSPSPPFARVTLSPQRVVAAEDEFAVDSAVPLGVTDPQCLDRVIFGEVLPAGSSLDPGNRVPDDEAVVYVGSFQGRGSACRTAATDSVNNIVLGLSQTAAHEIGHLVGLYHVALVDIMDRSPSRAFQRELTFARGQILTETRVTEADGATSIVTTVLTTVIQDPQTYFRSAFDSD